MQSGPVYITVAGGSSGWMIAILVAVLAAVGSFFVGYTIENYKRYRDGQAIAGSLRAEIVAIVALFDELGMEQVWTGLLTQLRDLAANRIPWTEEMATGGDLTFPPTIYEKVADRLGMLSPEASEGVVKFYNFLAGFRTMTKMAVGPSKLMLEARIKGIEFLLLRLPKERLRANEVVSLLDAQLKQKWSPSLR